VICKKLIANKELRFVEADLWLMSESGERKYFYHLPHAAEARPAEFLAALKKFRGKVPDRRGLQSTAKRVEGQIDDFVENPRWKQNARGNSVFKLSQVTLTVFHSKTQGINWSVGEKFGRGNFDSEEDAKRDLWFYLKTGRIDLDK
jgi:hypothetical protein